VRNDIYSVVIRPLVTEKGTHQSQTRNAYAFEVAAQANKAQI
jgi:large subunit ribosomal protein L23